MRSLLNPLLLIILPACSVSSAPNAGEQITGTAQRPAIVQPTPVARDPKFEPIQTSGCELPEEVKTMPVILDLAAVPSGASPEQVENAVTTAPTNAYVQYTGSARGVMTWRPRLSDPTQAAEARAEFDKGQLSARLVTVAKNAGTEAEKFCDWRVSSP